MVLQEIIKNYVKQKKAYKDQEVIIEEGEPLTGAFLIIEGQVKIKKRTAKGQIILEVLKQGSIIGESSIFYRDLTVRSATVSADGQVFIGVLDPIETQTDLEMLSEQQSQLINSLTLSLKRTNEALFLLVQNS
ncbi:MAG: cyclic nucleotide-binding domain-containing protein [Pseudomonadota bacterium]